MQEYNYVFLSKAQGSCESDKRKKIESFQIGGLSLDLRAVFAWESRIRYRGSGGSTTEEAKAHHGTAVARTLLLYCGSKNSTSDKWQMACCA